MRRVCLVRAFLVLFCVVTLAIGAERTIRRSSAMREGPASFFPVVMALEPGMQVTVRETRGSWVQGAVASQEGWVAQLAFEALSAGVDYAGMLGSEKAVVISSVDIAAATKGAFEANEADILRGVAPVSNSSHVFGGAYEGVQGGLVPPNGNRPCLIANELETEGIPEQTLLPGHRVQHPAGVAEEIPALSRLMLGGGEGHERRMVGGEVLAECSGPVRRGVGATGEVERTHEDESKKRDAAFHRVSLSGVSALVLIPSRKI